MPDLNKAIVLVAIALRATTMPSRAMPVITRYWFNTPKQVTFNPTLTIIHVNNQEYIYIYIYIYIYVCIHMYIHTYIQIQQPFNKFMFHDYFYTSRYL